MMTVRNCPECGRLFQGVAGQLCGACLEEMEADLRIVRDYLDDHPGASLEEVARGTGLRPDRITNLIKKGYVVANAPALGPACQSCGAPTTGGRFCAACIARLEMEINEVVQQRSSSERMIHTWKDRGDQAGSRRR